MQLVFAKFQPLLKILIFTTLGVTLSYSKILKKSRKLPLLKLGLDCFKTYYPSRQLHVQT